MENNSRAQVFRRGASLIFRERMYAAQQWFRNTWRLWLARAEAWHAWHEHDQLQAQMEPGNTLDASEPVAYDVALQAIETARINRVARRLGVTIPDGSYQKIESPLDGGYRYCLTDEGLVDVLPRIREAARSRRQEIGYWISLLTGLIGAVIGLVTVLM